MYSLWQFFHFKTLSTGCLLRDGFLLLVVTLTLFALSPTARATLPPPPPDGDYPNRNTAEGGGALFSLTTGGRNTAIGTSALFFNTTGSNNTAVGDSALGVNTGSDNNTAIGVAALASNTASDNTATGFQALNNNTTGTQNSAHGANALEFNTTGGNNTATGFDALVNNTKGNLNTATGSGTLADNTSGSNNTGNGANALVFNTTGSRNTADGDAALEFNTIGNNNVALGYLAGQNLTTGSNNIDIGANVLGVAKEANTIRIGKQGTQKTIFVAGIFGTAVTGSTVVVNSTGKLGVATSSARFKEGIKPMDKSSEAILALKPVTFHYKEEVDPDRAPQFGLVAEDVEKVDPELVVHDEQGKPFTVHYEAVNAMLLNEFLKEHRKVEELEKQIKALTAIVQKVSDRQQLSKPAPQVTANN
jgi:Chaperone of endosialidase